MKALWRILGDRVDPPAVARAGDLLTLAATSAPCEGRPMYAALRSLAIPDDAMPRLFHAASLLREHRGDGHIAALMVDGIGGLESHVLLALDMDMPAEKFGRIHHLPAAQLAAVIDGMRDRGLIADDGWLSDEGRAVKQRVEALHRRPRGEALRSPRPGGARRADRPPRADGRAARGRPGLGVVDGRARSPVRDRDGSTFAVCKPDGTQVTERLSATASGSYRDSCSSAARCTRSSSALTAVAWARCTRRNSTTSTTIAARANST